MAEAVAPVLRQSGPTATCLEIGGGSGAFAEHAIKQLMAIDAMPARYAILEPSADLRERPRERLQRTLTPLVFECAEWLAVPLSAPGHGELFAQDVIDAIPPPPFLLRAAQVFEDHVHP